MLCFYSMFRLIPVIPANVGIHGVTVGAWIALESFTSHPGLLCARNDNNLECLALKNLIIVAPGKARKGGWRVLKPFNRTR